MQARRREAGSLNGHVEQRSSVHSGPYDKRNKRNNLPGSLGMLGLCYSLADFHVTQTLRVHVKNQDNSNWLVPSWRLSPTVPRI